MLCNNLVKMFNWNTVLLFNVKNCLQETFIKVYELINEPKNIYDNRSKKYYINIRLNRKMRNSQKKSKNEELYYIAQTIKKYIKGALVSIKKIY